VSGELERALYESRIAAEERSVPPPMRWPSPREMIEVLADYVSQFEPPFPPGTPLPVDPTPGEEN
jgi:hypothetical protein